MTSLRPNYRRARQLAAEIEEARIALAEAELDNSLSPARFDDLVADIYTLEHALFLTGVSSEYEL